MAMQHPLIDVSRPLDAPPAALQRMSEDEFAAWCDEDVRGEWVDGVLIMMAPASFEHNDLSGWLASLLRVFAESRRLGVVVPEVQVRLGGGRCRRVPDILFVAADHLDRLTASHAEGAPDLIVEIVSPESEARDWREKYADYEAAGVQEYWVIDPMSQHVEVYALSSASRREDPQSARCAYRRLEERDGAIESTILSGFRLRTAWLWPATRPPVLEALRALGALG